jgi:thiol:disulfide interchange protein DsbD
MAPRLLCITACVIALAGAVAGAQSLPPRVGKGPHATVELITGKPSGRELWVGVRFRLDPEWHVYWRNPGDSGGPPRVQWIRLPPGWSAGEIEWPAPSRISLGALVNYGYTGEVVLPIRFTLATDRAQGGGARQGEATLAADVRWLVCHEICVPGKATISVPLDAASSAASTGEWATLIARARERVPRPAPKAWRAGARVDGDALVLSIVMDRVPERGTFFPLDESQLDDSGTQQVTVTGKELRFRFRKSAQLTALPKVLRGVVTFPSGAAYEVMAPIGSTSESGS